MERVTHILIKNKRFSDRQAMANKENKTYIIAWSWKTWERESRPYGGIAKVSACNEITRGVFFSNSSNITSHLIKRFRKKESLNCHIVEVVNSALEGERGSRCKKIFKTIAGCDLLMLWCSNLVNHFSLLPQVCVSVINAAMNTGPMASFVVTNRTSTSYKM